MQSLEGTAEAVMVVLSNYADQPPASLLSETRLIRRDGRENRMLAKCVLKNSKLPTM